MAHSVHAIIASEKTLQEAQQLFPSFVVCPLTQGLALVPLTREALEEIQQSEFAAKDSSLPLARRMAAGVGPLAAELSAQGSIAYVDTSFFGGIGEQSAVAWENRELTLHLFDDEDNMWKWPNTPISLVLRYIGVIAQEGKDEFDTIGLGRYRFDDRWADAFSKA